MKFNKKSFGLLGLAALTAVGGTWAFFSQSAAITNPFTTKTYDSTLIEHFNPADGDNWTPGAEVDKSIMAKNTGDYPVLVRVSMEEIWSRDGVEFKKVASKDGYAFNSAVLGEGGYEALQYGVDLEGKPNGHEDGLVKNSLYADGGDDSVVYKALQLEENGWINGEDGYWYWNSILQPGTMTLPLMNSVTLAANTDMGLFNTANYYYVMTKAEAASAKDKDGHSALEDGAVNPLFDIDSYMETEKKEWLTAADEESEKTAAKDAKEAGSYFFRKSKSGLEDGKKGYADANYDLTVTTEFVQATSDALTAEWGENSPVANLFTTTTP